MARKSIDITIDDADSSDNGKVFRITEKPVYDTEFWAMRAFGGMLAAGVNMPDITQASAEMLYHFGLASFMKIEPYLLKELLDEMMECVKLVPQPKTEPGVARDLLPGDIDDIQTLFKVRIETVKLHLSFFLKGVNQNIS